LVAIVVGGVTLITSREKSVLPYTDWLKQEKGEDDPKVREIIGQEDVLISWKRRCESARRYGDPQNYCDFYNRKKRRIARIEGDLKSEYRAYVKPRETHNAKTIVSSSLSPLVIGWGLGSIASVSVISSVLAVERNSRRD